MPRRPFHNFAKFVRGACQAIALSTVIISTSACAEPVAEQPKNSFEQSVLLVLENVAEDWNNGNYDGLKDHWDVSDPHPYYLAEESTVIMTNWSDVEGYWKASQEWIEWIVVDYSNFAVKRVDEQNAMVAFDLRFDLKLKDRKNPIGGDNRAVVSFRHVDGTWKIHSWVEAPLSAITYVRRLYELNVREDLPPR